MRRPHVYERSAPRISKPPYDEPSAAALVARTIAAQLTIMVEKAYGAGQSGLADLLEVARIEAENLASQHVALEREHLDLDHPKPRGPATDAIKAMDAAIEKHQKKRARLKD